MTLQFFLLDGKWIKREIKCMNESEVQQRVLRNGKPIGLDEFYWNEEARFFSSWLSGLVLDFKGIDGCTLKTGSGCTLKTGSGCTLKTGSGCTFDTSYGCKFDTTYGCKFDTSSHCTFDTSYGCKFDTDSHCVIVRRDVFEIIQPKKNEKIQLCPYGIPGYLSNGLYNGEPHIVADGILSKIVNKKGGVYKVVNHGEADETFLIESDGVFAHGKTLKEARDSLVYKNTERDLSKYEGLSLTDVLPKNDLIVMYRSITGACESGVRGFIESLSDIKDSYTVNEVIDLTEGRFGNEEFKRFFACQQY